VTRAAAGPSLAERGHAYGIPGEQVDGMDVLGIYAVTKEVVENARQGEGPALIESLTYRYGPHTMAGDDPTRYRTDEEKNEWEQNDPLIRFREYLKGKDLWSDQDEEQVIEEAKQEISDGV
jgi:pyruvate dehydrogenase E1 component alpha subunit